MRETASARRQAPRHVALILDSARKLGIRDAQATRPAPSSTATTSSTNRNSSRPGISWSPIWRSTHRRRHVASILDSARKLGIRDAQGS